MLYIANDTEIRSFVYPFNQSHGHKLLTRIEENARIIGMDALLHQQKFIWATQFNPGGLFYREMSDRSQIKTNVGIIVSMCKQGAGQRMGERHTVDGVELVVKWTAAVVVLLLLCESVESNAHCQASTAQ